MHKKRWPIVILAILLSVIVLFSVGCSGASDAEKEQAQQMADEFLEEKEESDDSSASADTSDSGDAGETKIEEEKVEEPQTFSIAETFNNSLYESTDAALDIILRGPMPLARAKVVFKEEKVGDNIYGDSSVTPQGDDPSADIILSGHFVLNFPEDGSVPPMDARVPCGMESSTDDPSVWVSCAGEGNTDDINTWYVFIITMQNIIPRYDDTRFRTIAVVFDSDNNPKNNFIPLPQYDYDFYQHTDFWYMWMSTPKEGWAPIITGENFQEVKSEARALYVDNTVALLIPGNDFPVDDPSYRCAADSHLGMMDPMNFVGNVCNEVPTNPPVRVETNTHINIGDFIQEEEHWLKGGYGRCRPDGCSSRSDWTWGSKGGSNSWCECNGCTSNPDCECVLFKSHMTYGSSSLGGKVSFEWEFAAGQDEKYPNDTDYLMQCWCVEKTGE